jgi:hypothetical protein
MLSCPFPYFEPSSIPFCADAGRASSSEKEAKRMVLRAFVFILFKIFLV